MSFSINTNVSSLQAQEYLRQTNQLQQKTISRVTSGLRIISSGDDAAGLTMANAMRSERAVLTQGIRNANDGISLLQVVDGGMSNIASMLDRARTLAAQAASDTFTGDRNALNQEFQSVLGEIDRQAQTIGLNTGGAYARAVTVFIGGGRASGEISQTTNGSITVDLSANATVDSTSLGLTGTTIAAQEDAITAVSTLQTAVATLGTAQAIVGKGQNQLNYAINLAHSQLNNMAASESRVRDADMAAEAANMTRAQILQQAGIAALAQATVAPQAVLALLRG